MNNTDINANAPMQIPKWVRVLSIIAVLWNVIGLLFYFAQLAMTDEAMASLPADQQEIYKNMPMWVTICFTIAVVAGTIGSIGLLLRKKWSVAVLVISLLGVCGQMGYMFFLSNTAEVMGASAMILPAVVVVIAIALIPFSMFCSKKGWLS